MSLFPRIATVILALLLVEVGAAFQVPANKVRRTGAISGAVTDGSTGRGIGGVVVSLSGVEATVGTVTDSLGRFAFVQLPPGQQYVLTATKSGYVPGGLARRNSNALPAPFSLDEGEWIADANVVMLLPGSISGTILDELGEPIVDISVRVLTRIPIAGTTHWATGTVARTDDRGFYRIGGLLPGSYIVNVPSAQGSVPVGTSQASILGFSAATAMTKPLPATAAVEVEKSLLLVGRYATPPPGKRLAYPMMFYPAARTLAEAVPVELRASEERRGIDLVLNPVTSVRVTGRVIGPADAVAGLVVRLLHRGAEAIGVGGEAATALVDADGAFMFIGVPAGQYVLDARTSFSELNIASPAALPATPGFVQQQYSEFLPWLADTLNGSFRTRYSSTDGYVARVPLTVGSTDVSDVVAPLRQGGTLRGRIVRDDGAPLPKLVSARVEPATGNPDLGGAMPEPTRTPETFVIRGLLTGEYFLRVSAGNLRVKSIGAPTGDFTNRPFEADVGLEINDVVVTLTEKAASVSGVVRDHRGTTLRNGAVIIFPVARTQWQHFGIRPPGIRSVAFFGSRGYRLEGLPAGEYFVIALDHSMRDAWQEPQFFAKAAPLAARVTLSWGGTAVQDLVLQQVTLR